MISSLPIWLSSERHTYMLSLQNRRTTLGTKKDSLQSPKLPWTMIHKRLKIEGVCCFDLPAFARGGHRAELNNILWHVAKWARFANARQKLCGCLARNWGAKTAYFWMGFSSKNVPDAKKQDRSLTSSVNVCCDYCVSGIRWQWHRIANVNKTIEIKSLVSRGPNYFKLAQISRRAA